MVMQTVLSDEDEAYSDFVSDDEEFVSLASIARDLEGVFVVITF